jgi:TolA-binding protein
LRLPACLILMLILAAGLVVAPPLPAQTAPEELTPTELYNQGRAAYDAGDWAQAESLFDTFVKIYGPVAETAEAARKVKPLLVTARLQQKKYEETLPLLEEVLKDPLLDPIPADEMAFWRGICHLQLDDYEAARAAFAAFYGGTLSYVVRLPVTHQRIHTGRRVEAVLLHGMCLMLEGTNAEAAAFFAKQIPGLYAVNREAAGRATVLRLHALMEAGDDDAAIALVKETYPRMAEITQVVVFHTLSLELGSRLLENGRYHEAIACLQRIWPRERLIATQKKAQDLFASRLEQVQKTPGQEYLAFQYEGLLTRIRRELENFEKIPNFDSALRLRVAMAYKELERYREAALILEDMLNRLPPDEIVRQASLSLIQCWMQIERWPKAVAAADQYLGKFDSPENPQIPMARFLKATALHANHQPKDAELVFAAVSQLHPAHELAPRALFMEGICLLEQDLNAEAIEAFDQLGKDHPQSPMKEEAFYWSGMALSFAKKHAAARDQMKAYLARYPQQAKYGPDARFRIAFSTFGLADYAGAIREFRDFLRTHPDSQFVEEAKLLLGDALGAEGQTEAALAAYASLDPKVNARFAEEGWFKSGNIHKLTGDFARLRTHFEDFIARHPKSFRLAEAVYWISLSHDQEGHRDLAQEATWNAIQRFGNQLEARGVEDMFLALPRLYPGIEGKVTLATRLEKLRDASQEKAPVLALRAAWARAQLVKKSEPEEARTLLLALEPQMDPATHSPRLLADVADAVRESGRLAAATRLYKETRRWHPRAVERDRLWYGLGRIAMEEGRTSEALQAFDRFEAETLGSSLTGEVAGLRGDLHAAQGQFPEAKTAYEKVLEMPLASRQLKARMLLKLGDLHARQQQDLKSTAYYERVYISYARYPGETAAAYLKRGQALERLGLPEKTAEVFREFAGRAELRGQEEQAQAVAWLDRTRPNWRMAELSAPEAGSLPSPAPATSPTPAAAP